MPEDDGLFEWPKRLGPAIKAAAKVVGVLALLGLLLLGLLIVTSMALVPGTDPTVAVVVGILLLRHSAWLAGRCGRTDPVLRERAPLGLGIMGHGRR